MEYGSDLEIFEIPAVVPEVEEFHFALTSDYSTYDRAVLQKFPRIRIFTNKVYSNIVAVY